MAVRSVRNKRETSEKSAKSDSNTTRRVRKSREARMLEQNKEVLGTPKVSSSKLQYTVKLFSRAPVAYSGQLLSLEGDVIEVRVRRKGGQKIDRYFLQKRDIVSIVGDVDGEAIVNVMEDHVMIAQYTGTIDHTEFGYRIKTADTTVTIPFDTPVSVKLMSEEPSKKKVSTVKRRSARSSEAA